MHVQHTFQHKGQVNMEARRGDPIQLFSDGPTLKYGRVSHQKWSSSLGFFLRTCKTVISNHFIAMYVTCIPRFVTNGKTWVRLLHCGLRTEDRMVPSVKTTMPQSPIAGQTSSVTTEFLPETHSGSQLVQVLCRPNVDATSSASASQGRPPVSNKWDDIL